MAHLNRNLTGPLVQCALIVALAVVLLAASVCLAQNSQASQPISSRAAFLRAQRASRQHQQAAAANASQPATVAQLQNSSTSTSTSTSTSATTTTTTTSTSTTSTTTSTTARPRLPKQDEAKVQPVLAPQQQQQQQQQPKVVPAPAATNRTTRTADAFQNGDGFNIFVTNTCERELMHVNIKTSREFYGVIHTRNQRQKSICTVEGNGDKEYNLDISHVLNQQDPNYCGVIRARKDSPEDRDLLSVVIAVRVHKNIELSDDKFFLLNCTNRCRRPDCSDPTNARLSNNDNVNGRVIGDELVNEGERENVTPAPPRRSGASPKAGEPDKKGQEQDECTIHKFPWVITLLWCLGILLLAMIISHCIMCSSLMCRCVRTEVEEREPSVYEDQTDDEDNLYNKKNHPMRIDYDNREIYKTSNNYEPYNLNTDDKQAKAKSRYSSSSRRSARR